MMNQHRCMVNEEDLLLYYYRELAEEQLSRLQGHLADCAGCRRRLEELSRTLDAFPPQELTWSSADQRLLARRVTERLHSHRQMPTRLWLGTAAAAAMVLLTVVVAPWRPAVMNPSSSAPAGPTILTELELLDVEFWQNFDLLQELDILEELEPLG